jgi:protein-disulfide isomerase
MIRAAMIATVFVALPLAGAAPVLAAPAARHSNWQQVVTATNDFGFRMGNPDAKIAIVEYGSLTCPHCRHFAETAMKPLLENYVRTGKASFEFRNFVLNPADRAATLIARCGGPSRFFPVAEQLYAKQDAWAGKVRALPDAEVDRINALPAPQQMLTLANLSGLFPVAAAHGIGRAKAERCLKDKAAGDALIKFQQDSADAGVPGTPYILVNGQPVRAYDWESLEPFLKDAGA